MPGSRSKELHAKHLQGMMLSFHLGESQEPLRLVLRSGPSVKHCLHCLSFEAPSKGVDKSFRTWLVLKAEGLRLEQNTSSEHVRTAFWATPQVYRLKESVRCRVCALQITAGGQDAKGKMQLQAQHEF